VTIALEKSFQLIYSNTHLNSCETVPLRCPTPELKLEKVLLFSHCEITLNAFQITMFLLFLSRPVKVQKIEIMQICDAKYQSKLVSTFPAKFLCF